MYRLEPYSTKSDVVPARIMYNISNYHQDDVSAISSGVNALNINENNVSLSEEGNNYASVLEQQKCIIDRLKQLEKSIKKYNVTQKANKKADKNVSQKPQKNKKSASLAPPSTSTNINSPSVVHATLTATTRVFPVHNYGATVAQKQFLNQKFTLQCSKADVPWVNLFSKLGSKRNVHFVENAEAQTTTKSGIQVQVSYAHSDVSLKGPTEVKGKVAVWKFLGTLLGLYLAEDVTVAQEVDTWLNSAEKLTKINDDLSRKLCRYLSPNDYLCGCNAICLPDIVVRSLFNENNTTLSHWKNVNGANNVQVWVKRVDESLASSF